MSPLLPKQQRRKVEYAIVVVISLFARFLPWGAAIGIGAFLGDVVFRVFRYRREVAMANLRSVFGGTKNEKEMERIALEAYRNVGRTFLEYLRFRSMKREEIEAMVEIEGIEHLDAALAGGRGAVLVTAHYGSWELFGIALAHRGYPVNFLVGKQHNEMIDALLNEHRVKMGIGVIQVGVSARHILQVLKRNELICILADQDARRHGVFVNFLGRPASTPQGPAAFAVKMASPIIVGFITRVRGAHHRGVVLPPIAVEPSGRDLEDIVKYTQAYTDRITAAVVARPEQWFWPHKRWKTRPARADWRAAG
jgi:KDO2-lipid IV(A) lauroyltransferase